MDNYFILQYCKLRSHNGFLSNFFIQEEGLRQGCNLSPLLFIIAAEIIASKIRQSNEIRGIELPSIDHDNKEAKITQFADDTTIFVRDELSLCNVIKVLDKFTVIFGLHLKQNKE